MRVGYADPPYPGCAHLYKDHPDYAGEVDHRGLIERLECEYDAWVLHTASTTLKQVLKRCPDTVRVMAWVKPFASFKPNVGVAYAWEPVIVHGGRRRSRDQPTVRDWCAESITLRRGLTGAKPESVCFWLFEVLGMNHDDELDDLYPGTSAVTEAWEAWRSQPSLTSCTGGYTGFVTRQEPLPDADAGR